ncbi:DUF3718 domain-containing protein [Colwelliaceae bacterium BS250]
MNIRQIIAALVLVNIALFATAQGSTKYIFKAADNSLNTKICVAAVNNNLVGLKKASRADRLGIKDITRHLKCNGLDITNFAATYDAYDTTLYLSKMAPKKYKIDLNQVEITDLAKNSSSGQTKIIYVSSK